MLSDSSAMPAWQQSILSHIALSIFSAKTGSVHSLHVFHSAHLTASLLSEEVPLPQDFKEQIFSLHQTTIQLLTGSVLTYINTIGNLDKTVCSAGDLKQAILSLNKTAIQNFSDCINASGGKAINLIQDLPPLQQNSGAALYSSGLSIINILVNSTSSILQNIIHSIPNMITRSNRGKMSSTLAKARTEAKNAESTAVDALGSLFGFSPVSSLAQQASTTGSAGMSSFTGFVGWNNDIGMNQAKACFNNILDGLDLDAYIIVVSQQLGYEDIPQHGLCLVGRVQFGPKFAAGQGSGLDLAKVWNTALGQAEKEGSLSATPLAITQESWQGILGGGSDEDPAGLQPTPPEPGTGATMRKYQVRSRRIGAGM